MLFGVFAWLTDFDRRPVSALELQLVEIAHHIQPMAISSCRGVTIRM